MSAWKRLGVDPEAAERAFQAATECACCRAPKGLYFAVDHDHATGQVRGVLCIKCNTGIANLGDNLEGVMRAVQYLQNSASPAMAPRLHS